MTTPLLVPRHYVCRRCGVTFSSDRRPKGPGDAPKFCSKACRYQTQSESRSAKQLFGVLDEGFD